MTTPFVQLEPGKSVPLYLQIYQRVRQGIAEGRLRPGDRVPPVRNLAAELNLARGTVEAAYQMLIGEGYLLPRGPAGTVISPQLAHGAPVALPPSPAPSSEPAAQGPRPFQLGLPALDAFPLALWTRLLCRRQREDGRALLGYPDPQGYPPLRQALAAYLGVSRGIACTADQVIVCQGYRAALALVCRLLMQPGDRWWFEDPGYFKARDLLEALGAKLLPVPVDAEGLDVAAGLARDADARFALVTPSHQSPLGVSLALPRRRALLDWASHCGAWVVEDDYDSEYRYLGRPLPALKSLDAAGRVLYVGTFSKVMFPGLRLAYLLVPEALRARFVADSAHGMSDCPQLLQATLADFIGGGHFARHLRRMRTLYAERRRHLCDALEQQFAGRLQVKLQAGGMHLLAQLPADADDVDWAARAQAAGLAVMALSPWRRGQPGAPALLLSFTNIASREEAEALVGRLRQAIDEPTSAPRQAESA